MACVFETLEQGQGLPLVLLHGLMGDRSNWSGVLAHPPAEGRAIALHMPFFEDAPEGEEPLNHIARITGYARDFLDSRRIERVVLCGNSLGGHVALHLALESPARVAGLVLTGSSGLFEKARGGHRGANPPRQWVYDKMCEVFYDPAMVTDEMVDQVHGIILKRRCARDLVHIAKSCKRDNLADRLPEVRCPVLLIWGRQDQVTPPEVAEEFHGLLNDCTLTWLDRCGHAPMIEHPAAFAEKLNVWWARRITGGAASQGRRGAAEQPCL